MNQLLNQLDKYQLITVIETLTHQLGIRLQADRDPGDNKPTIRAFHPFGTFILPGTFTVLNLNAMPRLTYRVSCLATLLHRLEFEVEADSAEQAIDFCAQRYSDTNDNIKPIDDEFIDTKKEDSWTAHPLRANS